MAEKTVRGILLYIQFEYNLNNVQKIIPFFRRYNLDVNLRMILGTNVRNGMHKHAISFKYYVFGFDFLHSFFCSFFLSVFDKW